MSMILVKRRSASLCTRPHPLSPRPLPVPLSPCPPVPQPQCRSDGESRVNADPQAISLISHPDHVAVGRIETHVGQQAAWLVVLHKVPPTLLHPPPRPHPPGDSPGWYRGWWCRRVQCTPPGLAAGRVTRNAPQSAPYPPLYAPPPFPPGETRLVDIEAGDVDVYDARLQVWQQAARLVVLHKVFQHVGTDARQPVGQHVRLEALEEEAACDRVRLEPAVDRAEQHVPATRRKGKSCSKIYFQPSKFIF